MLPKTRWRHLNAGICGSKKIRKLFNTLQAPMCIKCQLVFTWLIPWVDDEGRMRGETFMLKGIVFPYVPITEKELEFCLIELHKVGLIVWYEVDEEKFIQIEKWKPYKNSRFKPSIIQAPIKQKDLNCRQDADNVQTDCRQDADNPAANITPTPTITTTEILRKKSPTKNEPRYSEEFLEFWNLYDNKVDKKAASQWYEKNIIPKGLHQQVIAGVKRWLASGRWDDRKYQPNPMTFFHKERWGDEPKKVLTEDEKKKKEVTEKFLKGDL